MSTFFVAVYVQWTQQPLLGVDGIRLFLSYGLVILSFMAGTLWGQVVNASGGVKRIAVGFIALYQVESRMISCVQRPDYYLALRLQVTGLVLLAHGLMWVLL